MGAKDVRIEEPTRERMPRGGNSRTRGVIVVDLVVDPYALSLRGKGRLRPPFLEEPERPH